MLDGGLKKWVTDGFETTIDEPEIQVQSEEEIRCIFHDI